MATKKSLSIIMPQPTGPILIVLQRPLLEAPAALAANSHLFLQVGGTYSELSFGWFAKS